MSEPEGTFGAARLHACPCPGSLGPEATGNRNPGRVQHVLIWNWTKKSMPWKPPHRPLSKEEKTKKKSVLPRPRTCLPVFRFRTDERGVLSKLSHRQECSCCDNWRELLARFGVLAYFLHAVG